MESVLKQPISSLDSNKPVVLTRSIYMFNEFIKSHIHDMTGEIRKPYHGLSVVCSKHDDQCTTRINSKEIIADGNCLFDSLLYILGQRQTHKTQMDLREELVKHFIVNEGVMINNNYDLEDARKNQSSYSPIDLIKSFTDIYKRHVIVFELYNSGVINATLFANRTIPFDHVDFLLLTQNPGHFTTFTQNREFVQRRAFLDRLISIGSDYPRRRIRDLIIPGQVIPDFEERNYRQRICENYYNLEDLFTPEPMPELNPLYEYPNMFAEHGEAVARAFLNSGNSKSQFVPANASPTTMAQIQEAMEKENREIAEEMQRSEKEQMNRDMSLARRIENAISNISNKPLYNKGSKFVPKNASANILAEIEQSERNERRKEQMNRNASLARKLNRSSKSKLKSRLNAKNKSAKPKSSKFIPKSASNSIMAEIHKAEEKEKKEKENRERGNRQLAKEMERAEREQMNRNASLARRLQNNRSRSPDRRRPARTSNARRPARTSNTRRFRVSSIFNKHIPRAFSRIFRR
jgi:hypothetical protein